MVFLNSLPRIFRSGLLSFLLVCAGSSSKSTPSNNACCKEFFSMVRAGRRDVVSGSRIVVASSILLQTSLPIEAYSCRTSIIDKRLHKPQHNTPAYLNAMGDVGRSE